MAINSGSAADADDVMNGYGTQFLDFSQLLFNAKYIGFAANLTDSSLPNLDKVFFSTFESDDADVNFQFVYDVSSDKYVMTDLTGVTNYVIVEATSFSNAWTQGTNDVEVIQINSGAWLVYETAGAADEVQKAKVHKSLWWGDGTGTSGAITKTETPMMDMFTSVTAVKVSDAGDVGKQAHMIDTKVSGTGNGGTYDGTFVNTSTNTNTNSWSYLTVEADAQTTTATWEIPSATILNQAEFVGGTGSDVSDETEIDTSGDDISNPATVQIAVAGGGPAANKSHGIGIILCKGDVTWVDNVTGDTTTLVDYFGDNSIPVFTSADTLANEGLGPGTLIFKDTAAASVTNAIASINSSIDATSSEQISISADGGSNFTNVNNGEVARPTVGTALWRRIVITRATLDKLDEVTEQAVKYNIY